MFERLEEVILGEMERARLPGLLIALVNGNEIVWSRAFGYANVENGSPMTVDTVFSAQSLTKPVVATALLQCWERGGFRLDDPANRHLGPTRIQNQFEESDPVTIRQLMTHTSGLPVDTSATAPPSNDKRTLAEFVSLMAKTVRRPGQEIVYANWGYEAMGLLVERFSGKPWDEYVREAILAPLHMASTATGQPPQGKSAAAGHFLSAVDDEYHLVPPYPYATIPPSAAGSLFSTVGDLSRFLIAHLNGGACGDRRILKPETAAEMHRLHAASGRSPAGMGLGFRVARSNGRPLICHGGDGLGFTNFIGGYPEEKVGVVLSLNRLGAQSTRSVIANAALELLARPKQTGSASRAVLKRGSVDGLGGTYASTFWDVTADLTIEGGRPVVTLTGGLVVSDEGAKSYLDQIGDSVFLARDGMFHGFELTFERGADAKAVTFYGGVYPFRFDRRGDVAPVRPEVVDERAQLAGRWSGTAATPLGPLPVQIEIQGRTQATISTPFAESIALEDCLAEAGRVSGRFVMTVPGAGEMQLFPRLRAVAGKLKGPVYARGWFGETPLTAELSRDVG